MVININEITIAPGSEKDILLALKFRDLLFKETGVPDSVYIDEKDKITLDFYQQKTKTGKMKHFFAYNSVNKPVAVIGSLIKDDFPYFLQIPGFYGWIIDVYTLPEYRGQGLATGLLEANILWLKEKGALEIKLIPFGKDAKRVYERAGFKDASLMSVNLSNEVSINDIISNR